MATVVLPYQRVAPQDYNAFLERCSGATVFHTLEWMRIYQRFAPGSQQWLVCELQDGTLVAAMPVTVFPRLGLRAVYSGGFSVYGGPVCVGDGPKHALHAVWRRFEEDFVGGRYALTRVVDVPGRDARLPTARLACHSSSTHVVDLTALRRDGDHVTLPPAADRRVRHAAQSGVQVARSTQATLFAAWCRLCTATYVRHGRRPYPAALYDAVGAGLSQDGCLRFYVATEHGSVVGGAVFVCGVGQAYYWMTAADPALRSHAATDAILGAAVRDFALEGRVALDLGPSPPDAHGLTRFKRKWGGQLRAFRQYHHVNLVGRYAARWIHHGGGWRALLRPVSPYDDPPEQD